MDAQELEEFRQLLADQPPVAEGEFQVFVRDMFHF